MFNALMQVIVVTRLNLGNLRFRIGQSLVAVVGFAGVVLVFVGVLSIGQGFDETLAGSGRHDVAVTMRGGSTSELNSGLGGDQARLIAEAPGAVLSSPELLVIVDVKKRSTPTDANVPFRGVTERAFEVRGNIRIIAGRTFQPGVNEVIVGRQASAEFAGLDLGAVVRWSRLDWTIVGIFEADGGLNESEIWADARVLQDAYNRGNSYQVVYSKLESADALPMFRDALQRDPQLNVTVQSEFDYLSEQSRALATFITIAGTFIALLMGVGAVFGAINTMYITIAARAGEIATLRALGFGRFPVLFSVLVEGMVLGVVGGVIGAALAYLFFNGYQASTLNSQSFSQVAFAFAVTPGLLVSGIVSALLMGLLGGILPGIRAARLPIAKALREL